MEKTKAFDNIQLDENGDIHMYSTENKIQQNNKN